MLFPVSRRIALSPKWTRNLLWRQARAVPSLDLRFAENKNLVDATTGQNLVTFTRASSGTYVGSDGLVKTAAVNEARFDHNPTTGESLGLLVEEARTNNVLQSEDFATTWTASNLTVTTNSVVAPDGTTTADTIAPPTDGLTVTRFLRQNPILTTQQAYTLSVFAKVGTATTNGITLYVSDSTATNIFRANFNLFTLITSVGNTGWAAPIATIVPYPNGWYRCILTGVTSTVHVSLRAQIYLSAFGTVPDTYGSIHVWGAQLEAGSFPTSYIPTTTAAATRSADVASITGANFSSWYNQTEGTIFANATAAVAASILPCYASIDNGTTSERLQLRRVTNGTSPSYRVVAGGQSIDSATKTIGSPTGFNSHVLAYASSNYEGACNGTLEGLTSIVNRPTATQLQIGNGAGSTVINGTIKRLTYWPTRLSNTSLQQITQ